MRVLQGPEGDGNDLAEKVAKDRAAEKMELEEKYFHPQGRMIFQQEHGFPYPHPVTPFEEALQKFQLKQRKTREQALKKSLTKKISGS